MQLDCLSNDVKSIIYRYVHKDILSIVNQQLLEKLEKRKSINSEDLGKITIFCSKCRDFRTCSIFKIDMRLLRSDGVVPETPAICCCCRENYNCTHYF